MTRHLVGQMSDHVAGRAAEHVAGHLAGHLVCDDLHAQIMPLEAPNGVDKMGVQNHDLHANHAS